MRLIRPLPATDIVSLLYLVSASCIFAVHWNGGVEYRFALVQNIMLAVFVLVVPRRLVWRDFYPLVLIGLAYVQVGLFIRLVYGPGLTFDSLVAHWDALFFGVNPHQRLHAVLPGRFWAETMHLLYALFYPLLGGGFLYVVLRRRSDYARFSFVFVGSFLSFVVIFVFFPVSGPMEYRQGIFTDAVFFSNLVDRLYAFGIPAAGGAFPSSHVGQSVVLFLLLRPMRRMTTILILSIILGIGMSMAYISVHYAIDAVTGVPAGIALYYLWSRVYRRGGG